MSPPPRRCIGRARPRICNPRRHPPTTTRKTQPSVWGNGFRRAAAAGGRQRHASHSGAECSASVGTRRMASLMRASAWRQPPWARKAPSIRRPLPWRKVGYGGCRNGLLRRRQAAGRPRMRRRSRTCGAWSLIPFDEGTPGATVRFPPQPAGPGAVSTSGRRHGAQPVRADGRAAADRKRCGGDHQASQPQPSVCHGRAGLPRDWSRRLRHGPNAVSERSDASSHRRSAQRLPCGSTHNLNANRWQTPPMRPPHPCRTDHLAGPRRPPSTCHALRAQLDGRVRS